MHLFLYQPYFSLMPFNSLTIWVSPVTATFILTHHSSLHHNQNPKLRGHAKRVAGECLLKAVWIGTLDHCTFRAALPAPLAGSRPCRWGGCGSALLPSAYHSVMGAVKRTSPGRAPHSRIPRQPWPD